MSFAQGSKGRVLVVAGASGGHIFPALGLIQALKTTRREIEILLVLSSRCLQKHISLNGYSARFISTVPIRPVFNFQNLHALWSFLKSIFESVFLMLEFKPDVVVGFGSIDSVPVVVCAWCARVKTLLHEQNVFPGRANRVLAHFVDRIAVSFDKTKAYLGKSNIVCTGNPIRPGLGIIEKKEALRFFRFEAHKMTLLVMGGSQGSSKINQSFVKAVATHTFKAKLQVLHLSGLRDTSGLERAYKDAGIQARVFGFLQEMHYAYSACDAVICRGGATTISELEYFRLPALIIPYPFAFAHQVANAQVLVERGCAMVIKDEELDFENLREAIANNLCDRNKLDLMRARHTIGGSENANQLLAKEVFSLFEQ